MWRVPHISYSPFRFFIKNGPNISTPQLVNGGPSNFLSLGRSVIFSSPSFHLSDWHLTHFPIRLLIIILHQTTQKPLLLFPFIISLLPPCAIFLWHHSTISLGMLPSLPSNTGWTSLTCRFDFFSLPPTLNKPFSSMYESRLHMPLLLLNHFLSPVLPSLRWFISWPKTCCWCNLVTPSCAYSRNDTSRTVGDNAIWWLMPFPEDKILLVVQYSSYHPLYSCPIREERFQSFYDTFM